MRFTKEDGIYKIILELPFIEKKDIELFRTNDGSVIVHVGSQKRNIALPLTLTHAKMIGAELKNEELIISFRGEDND